MQRRGITVPPDDPAALAQCIRSLRTKHPRRSLPGSVRTDGRGSSANTATAPSLDGISQSCRGPGLNADPGPIWIADREVIGVTADRVTLFARGRVALSCILRALDVGPGDEVIVPSFTCVAVPNAIVYPGAVPVYVDIDPDTYTIDPAAAAAASPQDARILAQNTLACPRTSMP